MPRYIGVGSSLAYRAKSIGYYRRIQNVTNPLESSQKFSQRSGQESQRDAKNDNCCLYILIVNANRSVKYRERSTWRNVRSPLHGKRYSTWFVQSKLRIRVYIEILSLQAIEEEE